MNTIIQIRGTHGSGKSTAVRALMREFGPAKPIWTPDGQTAGWKPIGYQLDGMRAVGSYENECGGCDTIAKQDDITERVSTWARFGDVVFEGILASKTHERYAELARAHVRRGGIYVFAYLTTPLDVCLKRVAERRHRRGEMKPLNPENVITGYKAVLGTKAKAAAAGLTVVEIDWQNAENGIISLVRQTRAKK